MNIGGTSMHAPAQMAIGALNSALKMQESMAGQVIASGTSGAGSQMAMSAAAEQGKGQNLNITA